jgi:MFS family permease
MKSKRNIRLMFAISLLQGMVFYGPIATLYRQTAGVTVFQITIIESISLALCLLLELPWGILADKIGYKKTMIICCSLYVISKIVFWKATGFTDFLIERVMLSIVISGLSGVDSSILYLSCSEKESQKVFGIYNTLQTIGLLFASTIYSVFIGGDYRLSGLLTVCSYGIAALLALALQDVRKEKDSKNTPILKEFGTVLKQVLHNKSLLLFLLGVALLNETHQTITVFLNQLQYLKCGLSNFSIGYIYIGVTLIGLLGAFSAKMTRKLGILPFAVLLYTGAILSCTILTVTNSAWFSIIAISLLRLVFSLFQPLQMDLQNKLVISDNRATELSINAIVIESIGIGSNLIFGKLSDENLAFAMALGTVFCSLGLILFLIWYNNYRRTLPSI